MADDLRLGVDASAVKAASATLDEFEGHGRRADAAATGLTAALNRMSHEMQGMITLQRQANDLLRENEAANRATASAVDDNTRRMGSLATGVTVAAGAYALFHDRARSAADASKDVASPAVVDSYAKLGGAITGIVQQIEQLRGSRGVLGSIFGLDGASAQIDQLGQQLSRIITQTSLRTNLGGGELLQGIDLGARIGLPEQDSLHMIEQMGNAIHGVGQQWEEARRTLTAYGVTTRDSVAATKQFLDTLSQRTPSRELNLALESVFPGADPAVLQRSRTELLTPQGSGGRYQEQQLNTSRDLTAAIAALDERLAQLQNNPNRRAFFGLTEANPRGFSPENPLSLIPGANALYRYGQNLGQYFDPNSPQRLTDEALGRRQSLTAENQWEGKQGIGETLKENFQTMLDTWRNALNPLTGGYLGRPNIPVAAATPAAPAEVPEQYKLLAEQATQFVDPAMRAQERMTREVRIFADLLEHGAITQDEYNKSVKTLSERAVHLSDRFGYYLEQQVNEASINALPLNQREYARALKQAQFARNPAAPNEPLDPNQTAEFNAAFNTTQVTKAHDLELATDAATKHTNELAAAEAAGGLAVGKLNAEYQAHQEFLHGQLGSMTEMQRVTELLAKSFADLDLSTQKLLREGELHNAATLRTANAANYSPAAVRVAEAHNQAAAALQPEMDAAKTAEERAKVQNEILDRENQILQDMNHAAAQAKATREREFQQQRQDSGLGPLQQTARDAARQYGVPEDMFVHQIAGESGFRPGVVNSSGHVGIAQFDPATAARYGVNPLDPTQSLYGAAHYMSDLRQQQGSWPGAMQSYLGATSGQSLQHVLSSNPQYARAYDLAQQAGGNAATTSSISVAVPTGSVATTMIVPAGSAATVSSSGQVSVDQELMRPYVTRARQELESTGTAEPTQTDIATRSRQLASTESMSLGNAALSRSRDTEANAQLQQQLTAAIEQGVGAEKEMEDTIRVEQELRKATELAVASGDTAEIARLGQIKELLLANAAVERQAAADQAVAREERKFNQQQSDTGAQIGALQSGGLSAYNLVSKEQPIEQGLVDQGVPLDQAKALAQAQAEATQQADDYKQALLDASGVIKNDLTGGIDDIANALENNIGKAHGFHDALIEAGKAVGKMGIDTFITGPLKNLATNVAEGNGFTFDVGKSGISSYDALGQALIGGVGKSLGLGGGGNAAPGSSGGDNSTSNDIGGAVAAASGGSSLLSGLGKLLGFNSSVPGNSGGSGNAAPGSSGGDNSTSDSNASALASTADVFGNLEGSPDWLGAASDKAPTGGAQSGGSDMEPGVDPTSAGAIAGSIAKASGSFAKPLANAISGSGSGSDSSFGSNLLGGLFGQNSLVGNWLGLGSGGDSSSSGQDAWGGVGAASSSDALSGDADAFGGGLDIASSSNAFGGATAAGVGDALSSGAASSLGGLSDAAIPDIADSGITEGLSSIVAAFFGTGGIAGMGAMRRAVPAYLFDVAPRFASGGLLPDEVPAVLHTGERVLNRQQTKEYDTNSGSRAPGTSVYAPMNVYTHDGNSFREAAGQIATAHARRVDLAKN